MSYYYECNTCGSRLDPGERCDCERQKKGGKKMTNCAKCGSIREQDFNTVEDLGEEDEEE